MGNKPTFGEWLESVFQREVRDPSWWFDEGASLPLAPEADPIHALDLLTRLFETPSGLGRYTNPQVAKGLWFLFDSTCSGYMELLRNPQLPLPSRLRCIAAIFTLNRDLFAVRCAPEIDDPNEHSLSTTCHMLWDLSEALEPNPDNPAIDQACMETLTKILEIKHPVCQQSALHGLGHWAGSYPTRIEEIVDAFLSRGSQLHPKVKDFAIKARSGDVP
jgi:hypothetical protein